MFFVQFRCFVKGEKELTSVVIWARIRHANQPSSIETQTLMKFILKQGKVCKNAIFVI